MDPVFDGCRLCLHPNGECFTTIGSPQLKDQMEKVFSFPIEPKEGYSSGVCQSCSYAISEFYQYSEKVRQNQEVLNKNTTKCDPFIDPQITLDIVKVEILNDSNLLDTIEDVCEPIDELSGEEEVPTLDSTITLESVKVETISVSELTKTTKNACEPKNEVSGEEEVSDSSDDESDGPLPTKRRGHPGKRKLDESVADKPTQIIKKTRQERNEEDQLFNKHFRMICDLCGTSAATFTALCIHFKKEHERRDCYVWCCNKKLFNRNGIREHIDFHADPDVFRCDKCKNVFTSKRSLSRHMTNQHSGKNRTMACDTCGKTFLNKQRLDLHVSKHMGIEVQRQ